MKKLFSFFVLSVIAISSFAQIGVVSGIEYTTEDFTKFYNELMNYANSNNDDTLLHHLEIVKNYVKVNIPGVYFGFSYNFNRNLYLSLSYQIMQRLIESKYLEQLYLENALKLNLGFKYGFKKLYLDFRLGGNFTHYYYRVVDVAKLVGYFFPADYTFNPDFSLEFGKQVSKDFRFGIYFHYGLITEITIPPYSSIGHMYGLGFRCSYIIPGKAK